MFPPSPAPAAQFFSFYFTLPPHSSPQPPCFDGFESSSRRLAVQWLHNGADTCSPRPPVRICSLPPAPSARNLHPFHPRLYDF